MRYKNVKHIFRNILRHVIRTTEFKGIAAFLKQSTDTKELRTVQYVESHLYSGLKTILSLLNDSAFDQILANRSLSNLWNVLLNGFDVDIEKRGGALRHDLGLLLGAAPCF